MKIFRWFRRQVKINDLVQMKMRFPTRRRPLIHFLRLKGKIYNRLGSHHRVFIPGPKPKTWDEITCRRKPVYRRKLYLEGMVIDGVYTLVYM